MNNLLRVLLMSVTAGVTVFLVVIMHTKNQNKNPLEGKEFIGYIPKDALPQLHWEESESRPGQWNDKHSIQTVIGKDTVNANFSNFGQFLYSNLVVFKGTFPLSIDTIVYVRGHYRDNGIPWIDSQASLTPLKE